MITRHSIFGHFALLVVCLGWLALIGPAGAQNDSTVLVEQQSDQQSPEAVEGPVLPPPQPPANDAPAQAEQPRAKRPFMRAAESDRGDDVRRVPSELDEPMPPPAGHADEIEVRPTPPIEYDTDRGARRMYAQSGTVEIVMLTQNPADGCYYEILICVPACCAEEEPRMECGRGIFGRGVVEYCWPCGFEVEVKFRHILGDVKVEYDA